MAEKEKSKIEKEVGKFDNKKNTPEDNAVISADENKKITEKKESKPAVANPVKEEKVEKKVELEREYIVPLKRGFLNVPRYKRAKKAIKTLREFVVRHMGIRDRDLNKVKVDINLNNEIWFRGIKKPMSKIKVKAKKIDGVVYVELAEIPKVVGFKIAREEKRKASVKEVKKPKNENKEDKTEEQKVEEKEDVKAGAEMGANAEKAAVKAQKHTTGGAHKKNTTPPKTIPRNVK